MPGVNQPDGLHQTQVANFDLSLYPCLMLHLCPFILAPSDLPVSIYFSQNVLSINAVLCCCVQFVCEVG